MNIGIYSNLNRDRACSGAINLIEILRKKSINYAVADNAAEYIADNIFPLEEVVKRCDIMFVFGGDGTVISVAKYCAAKRVPILGINRGNLGFLTESNISDIEIALDSILKGNYEIEERSMIEAEYENRNFLALNEIILARGNSQHTIDIDIYVDGKMADIVTGDGVLVSTPTGSTAYSLSCGGAILSPDVQAVIITAMCPHSLHSRPMVVSNESVIEMKAYGNKDDTVILIIDGEIKITEMDKISVKVKKSECKALFVRINEENFYSKLITKLSGWNKLKKMESK